MTLPLGTNGYCEKVSTGNGEPGPRQKRDAGLKVRWNGSGVALCQKCGVTLEPGATIYRFRAYVGEGCDFYGRMKSRYEVVSFCETCTPEKDGHRAACHVCGRTIVRAWDGRRRWEEFCSNRCRWKHDNAIRSKRRAAPVRACACCGTQFTPKRADALYCSAACKQRAHRKRSGDASAYRNEINKAEISEEAR